MKRIFILHSNMELGGAETSLLGLLQSIDYSRYSVDLMLLEKKGALLDLVPKEVHLLNTPKELQCLSIPIIDVLLKKHRLDFALVRIIGRFLEIKSKTPTYNIKQIVHKLALPILPQVKGHYDLAISFIDPHYIIENKVSATIKMGWLHTDFSRIEVRKKRDHDMWAFLNYIVHISDDCKKKFDDVYPDLMSKSIVIENILSKQFIYKRALETSVEKEISGENIKLLSIGRFSYQKNFDNVPEICKKILMSGLNIKWYLIGYGSEEKIIRQKIEEAHLNEYIIILGKRNNPYPYINACDVYVQPSRYEGKCVAVREAQILNKPVVITNYATAKSQIEDGVDGVIVPMDNQGCAEGIINLLKNPQLINKIKENCNKRDYTNAEAIKIFDYLMRI